VEVSTAIESHRLQNGSVRARPFPTHKQGVERMPFAALGAENLVFVQSEVIEQTSDGTADKPDHSAYAHSIPTAMP